MIVPLVPALQKFGERDFTAGKPRYSMLEFVGLFSKTLTYFFNLDKPYSASGGVLPRVLSPTASLVEEKQKAFSRQK